MPIRGPARTGQAAGIIRFERRVTLVTYSRTGRCESFVGGWFRLALVWYRRGSISCCWPNSIF
jgi:hypothetical protein